MAIIITIGLLVFVVPQFEEVFKGFGADLPAATRIVVELSKFTQAYWWLILGGLAGGVFGLIKMKKTSKKFAYLMDKFSLKLPIIGTILRKGGYRSLRPHPVDYLRCRFTLSGCLTSCRWRNRKYALQ